MDQSALADRRQLRRKLGFWRIATILALVLAAGAVFVFTRALGGSKPSAALPHVARVEISGLIQDDRELVERLDEIAKSDSAKALVVSISSPGGTTYGGEVIYKALRKVAAVKPVVSDVRTLAASAGYMIALGGDTIVAGETSITGSIGVIFQYPQVKPLLDKIGVSLEEIKSSPLKAEPSPFHPATEESKAVIRDMINDSYGWFVDLVAERRKLSRDDVLKVSDGRIYTGRQAVSARLVDTLGDMDDIRTYLETRKIDRALPLVEWKEPETYSLFGMSSAMPWLLKMLGLAGVTPGGQLENMGADKLFLDGLVSVWQVGAR